MKVDIIDDRGVLSGWFDPDDAEVMVRINLEGPGGQLQDIYRVVGERWVVRTGDHAICLDAATAAQLQCQLAGHDGVDAARGGPGLGEAHPHADRDLSGRSWSGEYQDPTSRLLISSGIAMAGFLWAGEFAFRSARGVAQPYAAIIIAVLWLSASCAISVLAIVVTGGGPALARIWTERRDSLRSSLSRTSRPTSRLPG